MGFRTSGFFKVPSSSASIQAASGSRYFGGAVFVLDNNGRIQIASAAAGELWQAAAVELIGEDFPTLFLFEVISRDSGWVQSHWEVLVSAAQEQSVTLQVLPRQGSGFEALVRIEKAAEEPRSYFAFVSRPTPPSTATTPAFPLPQSAADNFLTLLNEKSPLGFFDLNFQNNEVYYSPAWKRQLGYVGDELADTYASWLALIHPDDSAAAPDRQNRAGATTGARQYSLEFRMQHARGHYVWVQSVGVQLYSPSGALQRVIGANLDIGDRKEFEEAGLRAEERIQQLGDRGRAGFFDLDFASKVFWLSPGFKALLGYTDADLPDSAESFLRALPMDETLGGLPGYFLAQQPNQVAYFDLLRLRHRDGREILVHAGIVRQISRRKELQRVLGFAAPVPETPSAAPVAGHPGLSAPELGEVFAELHEGVLLADANGQIVLLNAKAEQLLGRSHAEAFGQSASEIFRLVHRQSGLPGESPVAKALANSEAMPLNNEFFLETNAASAQLPVAFSSRPVAGPSGQPAGAVVVFRNPDEMSLTPEELVRANRFEALGQLAGGIAHDFNNLLTTILGGVSIARENHEYSGLENSERACLAAKALAKQLLTFAKGGTAVRQVVQIADLITDSVRLAATASTVKIDVSIVAGTASVCVDRAQMLQVFQNLLINAIQAMPTGQGRIEVNAGNVTLAEGEIAPLPPGAYVAIEVRDNGSGIKPEHLEKIFDPFFTTKKTGTGLGLATVLSIVKRHGGQMGIDTEVGVGTTFTVFLPEAEGPEEVDARRAPTLRFGTGRILFMDDDEGICLVTSGMLESLGYKYDIVRNGEEALQHYKRYLNIGRPYDVVIMDLTIIGGMGGEQTFRELCELDPEVRAVMVSGYDNEEMSRQYLEMGFCGYLTKPYRVGDLGRMIRTVLGK